MGGQLANPPQSNRGKIQVATSSRLCQEIRSAAPEKVRLDRGFGHEPVKDTVKTIEVVPREASIEFSLSDGDHGSSERIQTIPRPAKREANPIETAGGVRPIYIPDQTLFAERQFLATDTQPGGPFF